LAGTGWLTEDELKNFTRRKSTLNYAGTINGPEIFPSSGRTRRQAIHSLDFLALLHQGKSTKQQVVEST